MRARPNTAMLTGFVIEPTPVNGAIGGEIVPVGSVVFPLLPVVDADAETDAEIDVVL